VTAVSKTPPQSIAPPPLGRVRLRTLVVVRWIAIAGQTAAVLGTYFGLGFHFALFPTLGAIAISALLNAVLPFSPTT
jgi:two-component system sensor histidine kinase RegB